MSEKENFNRKLTLTPAFLHFCDGTTFKGHVNKAPDDESLKNGIWAEAAFTTGMTGYQETATDPSFLGQHIIYTTSHVGNYPSNEAWSQSKKVHAKSLIARNFSHNDFLEACDVPLFSGLDTRKLTKFLTTGGTSHKSVLTFNPKAPTAAEFEKATLNCNDLSSVSQSEVETIVPGANPIVMVNYGQKQAITDGLAAQGFPLVTVPYNMSAEKIQALNPRLIFLSNGPGDPRLMDEQIAEVSKMLALNVPIRGICLGHQLLTLALGAKVIRLPFGQRGANHPVLEHSTGQILITSQNHGYASDEESLKNLQDQNLLNRTLYISHRSLFDRSVEGMATTDHFLKSVQFHPEAYPGPKDAASFFTEVKDFLEGKFTESVKLSDLEELPNLDIPLTELKSVPYKKILLIGSGPIKIGQASEFDYSGTQACKALKEIGIDVVLLNSNPATIMTDPDMAFRTYIEPITKDVIKKIIKEENVDAVLSTLGGQTSLNICVELEKEQFLEKNGVKLLGANVWTIEHTEDRDLFSIELDKLGYQTGKRFRAHSEEEAVELSMGAVGFPLIIRRDFALGGKGAALVYNQEDLLEVFKSDISFPITMEKSLIGYKEVELEVMVDCEKNGVIICSIENVDPCGIHTGDSITVAPAQTISDHCYQQLRTISLNIAKHMGVVAGGANVQFAINPKDENDIVVIEMNPRVSRSSALASKATGYPIAKISALLAVGYTLKDILNDITKASPVAFEPTLDYVAVKIPIFPFSKFPTSSKTLGPQMRSVGEVLALGGSFNEALLKALRSLEMGLEIPSLRRLKSTPFDIDKEYLCQRLQTREELSMLTVIEALRAGITPALINHYSAITPWFIDQAKDIVDHENTMKERSDDFKTNNDYSVELLRRSKELGFSDKFVAQLTNTTQEQIFKSRMDNNIKPVFKAVDTCSGEFAAQTPYFYSTYSVQNEAISMSETDRSIVIMGSGPNRIGQGIEFDYSCVKSCRHLKSKNIKAIMVNSNPETVSTDYDSSDRLYISALYSEDLFDIFLNEKPEGIIACFSGQTGINVRGHIEESFRKDFREFKFLGSSLETLDLTEDRKRFDDITKDTPLARTKSMEVQGIKKMTNAMIEIGLPVIIRPSYVIGGESMYIIHKHDEVHQLPETLKEQLNQPHMTFQVENYLEKALEYDVDLIRDEKGNCVFTVCEHIEHAGVHSGDSGMISPPVVLTSALYEKMKEISRQLAEKLNVTGPINFQYAVKDGDIYCIEANPRGSRTLPFLSKAYNLSLPQIATDAMLGETIESWDRETSGHFCVKQSTFPFDRFLQDNMVLGPKMRSTGETMGIDYDKDFAVLKSYLGNYPELDQKGKILISLSDPSKEIILPYLKTLHKIGFSFYATSGTFQYIKKQGIQCEEVAKINEEGTSILDVIQSKDVAMVFNTPTNTGNSRSDSESIRNTAIQYGLPCFTRNENITAVMNALIGTHGIDNTPLSLQKAHNLN